MHTNKARKRSLTGFIDHIMEFMQNLKASLSRINAIEDEGPQRLIHLRRSHSPTETHGP